MSALWKLVFVKATICLQMRRDEALNDKRFRKALYAIPNALLAATGASP